MAKKGKKTAKKQTKKKAPAKKKPQQPGLYQLTLPQVGGAWNVIASSKKKAARMFREILKTKRLPAGAKISKTKLATGTCRIVCD